MNVEKGPCMCQDLKVTTTIVRNMDIDPLNADPNPCGHQTSQQKKEVIDTSIIRIKILRKFVIIVKSMDTSLRIALEHTSMVTTKNG